MDQLSINHPSIRASFGVYTNYKIPGLHGTSNRASMHMGKMNTPDSPEKWKMGKGRHA